MSFCKQFFGRDFPKSFHYVHEWRLSNTCFNKANAEKFMGEATSEFIDNSPNGTQFISVCGFFFCVCVLNMQFGSVTGEFVHKKLHFIDVCSIQN